MSDGKLIYIYEIENGSFAGKRGYVDIPCTQAQFDSVAIALSGTSAAVGLGGSAVGLGLYIRDKKAADVLRGTLEEKLSALLRSRSQIGNVVEEGSVDIGEEFELNTVVIEGAEADAIAVEVAGAAATEVEIAELSAAISSVAPGISWVLGAAVFVVGSLVTVGTLAYEVVKISTAKNKKYASIVLINGIPNTHLRIKKWFVKSKLYGATDAEIQASNVESFKPIEDERKMLLDVATSDEEVAGALTYTFETKEPSKWGSVGDYVLGNLDVEISIGVGVTSKAQISFGTTIWGNGLRSGVIPVPIFGCTATDQGNGNMIRVFCKTSVAESNSNHQILTLVIYDDPAAKKHIKHSTRNVNIIQTKAISDFNTSGKFTFTVDLPHFNNVFSSINSPYKNTMKQYLVEALTTIRTTYNVTDVYFLYPAHGVIDFRIQENGDFNNIKKEVMMVLNALIEDKYDRRVAPHQIEVTYSTNFGGPYLSIRGISKLDLGVLNYRINPSWAKTS